jgi:tRNA(fMet)-specific endonuclease VapC
MYILDTDHLSVLDRGGATASNLLQRLATVDPNSVATSIINYEEQMRGWMSYTAKAQAETQLIEAYRQLKRQLQNDCAIPVVEFDEAAVREFQRIRKLYPFLWQ